jgi:hypothetical protein
MPLPSEKMRKEVKAFYFVFLTTEENKKKMEGIICEELENHSRSGDGSSLEPCFILDKRTYEH